MHCGHAFPSLHGPCLAGLPFSCVPTAPHSRFDPQLFRRKAGERVSLNVRVKDTDLARPDTLDNRRLEIVADGLPLFLGALACEVGRRWSEEAQDFVHSVARAKARGKPPHLRSELVKLGG